MTRDPAEVRAARIAILDHVEQLAKAPGWSVALAASTVASLASVSGLPTHIQALVPIANERGNASRAISRSSIMSWHHARARGNL